MVEKMIYIPDKMDDIGWSEALDMIRVLRKMHTKMTDTVSPESVNQATYSSESVAYATYPACTEY